MLIETAGGGYVSLDENGCVMFLRANPQDGVLVSLRLHDDERDALLRVLAAAKARERVPPPNARLERDGHRRR